VRTHKEVSDSPSSGAVSYVVGVDDAGAIKADVERNLKLWSAQEALRNG
jgi:hypothetical protein